MSERTYVAMSPNCWGKGATVQEAKDTLKEYGGNLNQHGVWLLPEGATKVFVDQMGSIRWTWEDDATDKDATTELVSSRGLKGVE